MGVGKRFGGGGRSGHQKNRKLKNASFVIAGYGWQGPFPVAVCGREAPVPVAQTAAAHAVGAVRRGVVGETAELAHVGREPAVLRLREGQL